MTSQTLTISPLSATELERARLALKYAQHELYNCRAHLAKLQRNKRSTFIDLMQAEIAVERKRDEVLRTLSWVWDAQQREAMTQFQPYMDEVQRLMHAAFAIPMERLVGWIMPSSRIP